MGSFEVFFFGDVSRREGFTSPARPRGAGGATRETDSVFSTLRARRAGHGARARARLATGGSPVDSPSYEASGAEIGHARRRENTPPVEKNTILLCYIFHETSTNTYEISFFIYESYEISAAAGQRATAH